MLKLQTDSKTDLLTHLGIILASALVLFFAVFFLFLPWITNLNEEIIVPDLKGLSVAEAENVLSELNLDYEVSDCTFVIGAKPLSVYTHYPKAHTQVKENRKIFLTIINDTAPKIKVPSIIGRSVASATNQLRSAGLVFDKTEFIPAIEKNTVLRLKSDGREIMEGDLISKGAKITLVVGDGLGNTDVQVPDLTGLTFEEAEVLITGSSLNVGSVLYDNSSGAAPGRIVKQMPTEGSTIKAGESVNIWVSSGSENVEE